MEKLIEIGLVATKAHEKLTTEIGSMATRHVKKLAIKIGLITTKAHEKVGN